MAAAGHVFEEHTGEVRLRLWAPDLAGILAQAAVALAELLADEPPGAPGDPERVVVQAPDRAALVVSWLNELIFLSETRQRIYSAVEGMVATDVEATAQVRGWQPSRLRTQVKAATFHCVSVQPVAAGLVAEVVLDV